MEVKSDEFITTSILFPYTVQLRTKAMHRQGHHGYEAISRVTGFETGAFSEIFEIQGSI